MSIVLHRANRMKKVNLRYVAPIQCTQCAISWPYALHTSFLKQSLVKRIATTGRRTAVQGLMQILLAVCALWDNQWLGYTTAKTK